MDNLELCTQARRILEEGCYTCVIIKNENCYTSTQRGVKPLVQFLHSEQDFCGAIAADRVVGKATAFLYVLLGVKALYSHVVSQSALNVLEANGIAVSYDTLTPHIINRQGNGICPFEEAVMAIGQPEQALPAIYQKMSQLGIAVESLPNLP